jgi:alpha-ketoglutarate-dependent taurine dioxygenase
MLKTDKYPCVKEIEANKFPAVIHFEAGTPASTLVDFFNEFRSGIETLLLKSGAVLFSGVDISSRDIFEATVSRMGDDFINYADGNSPRTKLSDKVYTSTEFDPAQSITMHNELSYSAKWPSRIFFSCIQPSETGGETPLADGRLVLKHMDAGLVEKIRQEGVIYYRNLHGGEGFGPSWQDTFETNSREAAEAFCREAAIDFVWKDDGGLRLIQKRKGILEHPVTGELVWFNQVDQFHPYHLGQQTYEVMMDMYGSTDALPTYASFGDGSSIPNEVIASIKEIFNNIEVVRPWEKGDLVLVDNVLVSHGRKPFTGARQILVSMLA